MSYGDFPKWAMIAAVHAVLHGIICLTLRRPVHANLGIYTEGLLAGLSAFVVARCW
jgi:hypothetical protein